MVNGDRAYIKFSGKGHRRIIQDMKDSIGYVKAVEISACTSRTDARRIIQVFLPYVIKVSPSFECDNWVKEHFGEPMFGSFGRMTNPKGLWTSHYSNFYFKNKDDAMLFKVVWG